VVFLGDSSVEDRYAAEFRALVAERAWCEAPGFANRSALKEQLSNASVLALPSLEDNCPMVVLEAAAAGVPVVAARVGGVPELVRHGETGVLFDPENLDEIRSAIERMILNREFANEVAARARKESMERFSPEGVARRHIEVYREVLSTRS
jgi:glycosyltransferase involved in cell wall biosynthesis